MKGLVKVTMHFLQLTSFFEPKQMPYLKGASRGIELVSVSIGKGLKAKTLALVVP